MPLISACSFEKNLYHGGIQFKFPKLTEIVKKRTLYYKFTSGLPDLVASQRKRIFLLASLFIILDAVATKPIWEAQISPGFWRARVARKKFSHVALANAKRTFSNLTLQDSKPSSAVFFSLFVIVLKFWVIVQWWTCHKWQWPNYDIFCLLWCLCQSNLTWAEFGRTKNGRSQTLKSFQNIWDRICPPSR